MEKVGQGMPCQLKYKKENSLEAASTYSKSGSRTLYDTVTIDLGSTCPINYDTSDITISYIYELPNQSGFSSGTEIELNSGFYLENTALFTSAKNISTSSTVYEEIINYDSSQSLIKPYVTARVESEQIILNDISAVRYVVKINRGTMGMLKMDFTSSVSDSLEFCKVEVVQIGHNLACADKPEGYTDKYMKTKIDYSKNSKGVRTKATLEMDGLTNYGSNEIMTDAYADDDSIEIKVYFKYVGTDNTTKLISKIYSGSSVSLSKDVSLNLNSAMETEVSNGKLDFEFLPTLGSMHLMDSKSVVIDITVPVNYSGPANIRFSDKDFSKKISLCGIFITKVGENLPCLHPQMDEKAILPNSTDTLLVELDDLGNPIFYKEFSLPLDICQKTFSSDPAENKFQLEFTFKPNSAAADGDTINFEVEIKTEESTLKEISITLSNSSDPGPYISNTSYPEVMANSEQLVAGE